MQENNKKIIGRLEYVDLPDFGLSGIVAKIDTGAYNGAIHTTYVTEKEVEGKNVIEFSLLDEDHPKFKEDIYQADDFRRRKIKSSNGNVELRYVVSTKIFLAGREIPVELSLSNRKSLKYPILLGRKIINSLFIVDVSEKFLG